MVDEIESADDFISLFKKEERYRVFNWASVIERVFIKFQSHDLDSLTVFLSEDNKSWELLNVVAEQFLKNGDTKKTHDTVMLSIQHIREGGGYSYDRANRLFVGNSAGEIGGAVYSYCYLCEGKVINCTFTGNSAGQFGGAIFLGDDRGWRLFQWQPGGVMDVSRPDVIFGNSRTAAFSTDSLWIRYREELLLRWLECDLCTSGLSLQVPHQRLRLPMWPKSI